MNEERIDDLAYEAGCHRHKYWDPKHPDLEGFIINQETLEKFAELIVQECIKELENDTRCRIAGADKIVAKPSQLKNSAKFLRMQNENIFCRL